MLRFLVAIIERRNQSCRNVDRLEKSTSSVLNSFPMALQRYLPQLGRSLVSDIFLNQDVRGLCFFSFLICKRSVGGAVESLLS